MAQYEELRMLVRGAYQMQQLRVGMGNRVVATYKVKLGQAPSTPEEAIAASDMRP